MYTLRLRLFAYFLLLLPLSGHASPATEATHFEEGKTVLLTPEILRPTQFNVGMDEVRIRRKILDDLMKTPTQLVQYLEKNRASAVIGPGGQLYLIDGHHISRAVFDSGLKEVHVKIEKDYSNLTPAKFWEKMGEKLWTYLNDEGRLRPASELPKTIRELTDDPFRTLAWMVRKVGGYEKVETPFAEFKWADYFRQKLGKIDLSTPEAAERTLNEALKLTSSDETRHLPGWIKSGPGSLNSRRAVECRAKYRELEQKLFH